MVLQEGEGALCLFLFLPRWPQMESGLGKQVVSLEKEILGQNTSIALKAHPETMTLFLTLSSTGL